MISNQALKFELFPGTLKIDPGRCFLHIKVHGKHDRLTCSVLPIAFQSAAPSDNSTDRIPSLSIIAFRSKKWGACTLFGDSDYPLQSSRIIALTKLGLNTPRGYLECVEPSGWSKIEIAHPGHWSHPGKGFHMMLTRNDMYLSSRMDVIWTQDQDAYDEQHYALNWSADNLGNWVARLFRSHELSLAKRYQESTGDKDDDGASI